ncbi:MAG: 6,7-dimethyl-8-ribityllumazine synthase [Candidatus Omnitrophota bacterium]|nr:6,7-dimethyl-8-ribityllumazine synthase [Candidatus Omnitrophota bacterium]
MVASKFHEAITRRLVEACRGELQIKGVRAQDITLVYVPGAFEISLAAMTLAKRKNIDAVICLGAIIKGDTYHFHLIALETARGIAQAALTTGKPVIFEVLATETMGQAKQRSQSKGRNKGQDAALAALEMIDLLSQLKQ